MLEIVALEQLYSTLRNTQGVWLLTQSTSIRLFLPLRQHNLYHIAILAFDVTFYIYSAYIVKPDIIATPRSEMGNLDGGGGHIIYVLATRGPQIHLEHTHTNSMYCM